MAQRRHSTNTQRMAEAVLGTDLKGYLEDAYQQGLSYEAIARALHSDTDGKVSISYGTVKRWLNEFGLLEVAS